MQLKKIILLLSQIDSQASNIRKRREINRFNFSHLYMVGPPRVNIYEFFSYIFQFWYPQFFISYISYLQLKGVLKIGIRLIYEISASNREH